jgi:hypothetical protein
VNGGDVAQVDRLAVFHTHDQPLNFGDGVELARHTNQELQVAEVERAAGHIQVRLLNNTNKLEQSHVVIVEELWVGLDRDFPLNATNQ